MLKIACDRVPQNPSEPKARPCLFPAQSFESELALQLPSSGTFSDLEAEGA